MNYRVLIDPAAAKTLEKISKNIAQRIDHAIVALSFNPRPHGAKMLRGKLKEGWRIRIANYRVLYRIDDGSREVRIYHMGHRREVYR